MQKGSILDKLTKRFQSLQGSSAHLKEDSEENSHPPIKKPRLRREEMLANNSVKREGAGYYNDPNNQDSSSSSSSPYVIKAKGRKYGGSFFANNKTFNNLQRPPKYEMIKSAKKMEEELRKAEGVKKKEQGQDADEYGIFDERFKRKFVLSLLQTIDRQNEGDKLSTLRKKAQEAGIGFFDAKIWVLGYKLVFQIEDELRNTGGEITEEMIKRKIATRVRSFWEKNTHEKRYYLLKLQAVLFRAFDIFQNNPGIWFDNNVARGMAHIQTKKENGASSYDIYGGTAFHHTPPPDPTAKERTRQMPYFSSRYAQREEEKKPAEKNVKETIQVSDKMERGQSFESYDQRPRKNRFQQKNDVSSKSEISNPRALAFPVDFRAKVAEKLDSVFSDFINKTLLEKAGQFCMSKEVLQQIYDNFGSINLQKKRVITCDRFELKRSIQESGIYTEQEVEEIVSRVEDSEPLEIQKMLLKDEQKGKSERHPQKHD